jgi:hypothetical protein
MDEVLSLHLKRTEYTVDANNDHQHNFMCDEQWNINDDRDDAIPYYENDSPTSPISVLGARPVLRNELSSWIVSQKLSPYVIPSSSLSPSVVAAGNESDTSDRNVHHPTKWTQLISTVQKAPTTLGENDSDDFLHDHSTTMSSPTGSCNDVNTPTIVPRWKLLQEKRLALCRQRVHLERRLFETSIQQKSQINAESILNQPMKTYRIPNHDHSKSDTYEVLWSGLVDTDGLPTGFGRMIHSESGQVYEGHCVNGLRHGQGRNVWTENEQIYTGEWVENQREGRGTHTWPDGRSVTGSWMKGHLHGRVFFTWPDGTTYDGDTVHGQKEGRGTQTWRNGRVYTGQYLAGLAHGVGMLTESNQSKYRGQFQNGSRHGYGVQLWPDKVYEGEWYNNEVHGRGSLLWRSTGATYTGEFKHGKYHGIGIYKEGNKQYVGHWRDGYREGSGKATWPDGRSYEGSFIRNKRHGYGRMLYADCSLYVGGWEHGKRCGQGVGINSNGIVQHCGLWIKDHPSDVVKHVKSATDKRLCADDVSISYQDYSSHSMSVA